MPTQNDIPVAQRLNDPQRSPQKQPVANKSFARSLKSVPLWAYGLAILAFLSPIVTTRIWLSLNANATSSAAPIAAPTTADSENPNNQPAIATPQVTTIPFVKNHEFNYSKLLPASWRDYSWVLYILVVIFIITAVSNGSNLTDGLDGLATGTSAIIGVLLGIFAYASGNLVFADYLNIMYIPDLGELSIFIAAMIGACIGFLWYNSYPAQIFMGDTGSLTLGGIIAALAIIVHKELLIPIFCGVFFVETASVMIQVGYFKYTKRKFGVGKRAFLKAPLHHHYQVKGYHEVKIVNRFWIVTVLLVVLSIVTLKLR